ncbi:hypothetical protein pb186bvf_002429 [Paramecium bursaria]
MGRIQTDTSNIFYYYFIKQYQDNIIERRKKNNKEHSQRSLKILKVTQILIISWVSQNLEGETHHHMKSNLEGETHHHMKSIFISQILLSLAKFLLQNNSQICMLFLHIMQESILLLNQKHIIVYCLRSSQRSHITKILQSSCNLLIELHQSFEIEYHPNISDLMQILQFKFKLKVVLIIILSKYRNPFIFTYILILSSTVLLQCCWIYLA